MASPRQWTQWIYQDAPQFGLDPQAAWAISTHEGLSGRAGDNNTSFGPFQLHRGGALPHGRGRKWAESRAGVDYALRAMANAGARGLRGRAAIATISKNFEKPSDVPAEIRDALAHYGRGGGIGGRQAQLASLARNTSRGALPQGPDFGAIGALLAQVNPNVAPIFASLAAAQQSSPTRPVQRPVQRGAGAVGRATGARINELFYDPLGGIKNNHGIGAIGGHEDHVHMSLSNARAQARAIQQAQRMGLRVGQNLDSNVTRVHVADSFHYRKYNKNSPLRMAADVSGNPRQMAAFYKWVAANH